MVREFRYQFGDQVHLVTVEPQDGHWRVRVDDQVFELEARTGEAGRLDIAVDGRRLRTYVATAAGETYVALAGETYTLRAPEPRRRTGARDSSGSLTAAMPGRVLDVLVAPGDAVAKGDTLVLLEAMKMELRIDAPLAGQVVRVLCAPGQVVERGELLVELQA